jgi:hypothetical protein
MQESIDRSHWKDEIEGWINKIYKYKWNKNKRFESDDYYTWLCTDFIDSDDFINNEFKKLINQYKREIIIDVYKSDEFCNICELFWRKISVTLESNYNLNYTYNLLDELFDIK